MTKPAGGAPRLLAFTSVAAVVAIVGSLVASPAIESGSVPQPEVGQSTDSASQFALRSLSPFAADKARRLIRDRFACLGCHQLDGVGGRIGPDLSTVANRLTPDAIYLMIRQPETQVPGTVMPMLPMTDDRRTLIASFLATQGRGGTRDASVVDRPVTVTGTETGSELYARFCASCHGVEGDGDGFNAQYLPVPPTVHSDSTYMSSRPDDTLFDGIHAGGRILGKSHRMPGFGQRLSFAQIRSLVRYIRELCSCTGPAWSLDGGSG